MLEHIVGFDIESSGKKREYALQPWRATNGEAWVTVASVATLNEGAHGKIYPTADHLRQMLAPHIQAKRYIVGWNVAFDVAWLIALGLREEAFEAKWLDAMLLWKHAVVEPESEIPGSKRKKYALEHAMKEFYPEHSDFKEVTDFHSTDMESLKRLLYRNTNDALWPVKLAQKFWGMLSPEQQRAALIEAKCIPLVAESKVQGIYASEGRARNLVDDLKSQAIAIYRELYTLDPNVSKYNLNSSPQLQKLIYEDWGLPAARFSKKTNAPSTDKYALFDLSLIDKRADLIRKLREAKGCRQKYGIGTLKSLEYNGDGRVRPQPKIFSTYTSRMTYASSEKAAVAYTKTTKARGEEIATKNVQLPVGVALRQWKRGKLYRQILLAPPGHLMVELDFAGQEFRWMAVKSGDETMLALCAPGEDAHGYMGAQISQQDYRALVAAVKSGDAEADFTRKCGKFCNLSYQYRVTAATATWKARVDYGLDVDETFIGQTQSIYKSTFTGVGGRPDQRNGGYWGQQIRLCRNLGYAETMAGRRVQLKGSWSGRTKWGMESTAINYPIQGTGGDQKYLAMAVAKNMLPKYDGKFYYELHDGLFFFFPEKKAAKAAVDMCEALSNLPYKAAWGVDLPIKFPVDAKIGESWGDLIDLDKHLDQRS